MNKKVFITGAGSGLGKEAAIRLAKRGHSVYASVYYENQIQPLLEIAKKESLDIKPFKLDILNEEDRKLILNYDIDAFISNAAIGTSGSVADFPIDQVEEVFNTNVFANLHIIQLAIKNMIDNKKKGRIIILSSLVGRLPLPFLSPYCASKFALEGFGICLRQEMKMLKYFSKSEIDIKVSLIEPGAYATGFNKENTDKKYEWMYTKSYFADYTDTIRKYDTKVWNFLEQKPYTSITNKYIKAVESKRPRFRYTAPWWQSMSIQIARIFGS